MSKLHFGWFIPGYGDEAVIGDRSIYPPNLDMFIRVAQAAEDAGFEYALFPVAPDCWEAWISGAIIAAHTQRLKMLVAARPGYILPTLMAKMIATFDQLTQGRLLVNLISNTPSADGLHYVHDDRYRLMDEMLTVMKRLWLEDAPVIHKGEFFDIAGGTCAPKPYQKPWPKFYLGGLSEASREVAAKHADVQLWWGDRPERVAEGIADLRARADRHGRDPNELQFGMRLQVVVRETEEEAWQAAWDLIASAPETLKQRLRHYGLHGDSIIQGRQVELQMTTEDNDFKLTPHLWAGVGTVRPGAGISVVGNPRQVAETLQAFVDAGCTEFCLSGYLHDVEARRFGELVMPYFQDQLEQAMPQATSPVRA